MNGVTSQETSGLSAKDAANLKVGDRVMWGGAASDLGTVIDQGYCATTIKWDNGQTGIVHHNDFYVDIARAPK